MSERYYDENGNLAVLVSHGYGIGWSYENIIEFATDRRLVELVLNKGAAGTGEEAQEICAEIIKEKRGSFNPERDHICMLGWDDVDVEWIPKGSLFKIREYDGAEWIEVFNRKDWIEA